MRKNRNRKLIALIAVLCVFLVGGTVAYFSDQASRRNTFTMGEFHSDLEEKFDPPSDWKPGMEVQKEVKITNTGNVDLVAVARFDENCVRREDVIMQQYDADTDSMKDVVVAQKGEILPVIFNVEEENGAITSYEELALKNFGTEVVPYEAGTDPASYEGKWVYTHDVEEGVYYFLYMGIVPAGQESPLILESVTMNPKAEATITGTYQKAYYDEEKGEGVKEFTYTKSEIGYDSAHYTMDIHAKTLQASEAAIADSWKAGGDDMIPEEFSELVEHLQTMCGR